ncbi:MAG: hypothetical protein NVS3B26_05590 [Mycobacteriales bacterium]
MQRHAPGRAVDLAATEHLDLRAGLARLVDEIDDPLEVPLGDAPVQSADAA